MSVTCFKCQAVLALIPNTNISRTEECPSCRADLHICKMCDLYDPKHYNECKESQADRITDKEKKNFCDYFKLTMRSQGKSAAQSAMDAANALFKK